MYNPKVSDFLKENKDITVMGLFWSMYWRWFIIMFGVGVFLALIS